MGINHFRSQRMASRKCSPRRPRRSMLYFHGKLYNTRKILLEGMIDPINQHWRYKYHVVTSFLDGDQASSFETPNESSEDGSCCGPQSEYTGESALPTCASLSLARELLTPLALDRFRAFSATVERTNPPGHKMLLMGYDEKSSCPPTIPNRPRIVDRDNAESFLEYLPAERQNSFKCPFYASDPLKYRRCLLSHDLRSIESVLKHTTHGHARPPYCPKCSQTFDTVVQCDEHIIEERCVTRRLIQPDGLNSSQRRRLRMADNLQLTDHQRWEHIYMRIFPKSDCFPSPYLDADCERTISTAREFWRNHGYECISDLLESQDAMQIEGQQAKRTLFNMVLKDLIRELTLEEGQS
jgi:hypothetical protein